MLLLVESEVIRAAFDRRANADISGAVELVTPYADQGDRSALMMICWLHVQRDWHHGIPYAKQAAAKGLWWTLPTYIANLQAEPNLRPQVPELAFAGLRGPIGVDPMAIATNLWSQNDHETPVCLVESVAIPLADSPEAWDEFRSDVMGHYEELRRSAGDVNDARQRALEAIEEHLATVQELADKMQTRSAQLETLIIQTTNEHAQTQFDAEATKNEAEARKAWWAGIITLVVAAALATLPILIYYLGLVTHNRWLRHENLVAAHLAPAVAIAAVAGVLLARARGRDQARQRSRSLAVALATMFVYSGQIVDDAERQVFIREMGRSVIEASLSHDVGHGEGEGSTLLGALIKRY